MPLVHRNPHAQLRVFEVDHPATQAWKRSGRRRFAAASPPLRCRIRQC
jgi:O-methyltransferase involved in polyketide biosynthesis